MTGGPDGDAPPDIIARLDAELAELRPAISAFFTAKPYPVRLEHDEETGQYVAWFDLGGRKAPIPGRIIDIAERLVADLLDAHERGHGEPSADWEALVLIRRRLADVLEPILVAGKSRFIVTNADLVYLEGPVFGPFGDQQVIARGAVSPPDAKVQDVLLFDVALKEAGSVAGPLDGRSLLDLAEALYKSVREDLA